MVRKAWLSFSVNSRATIYRNPGKTLGKVNYIASPVSLVNLVGSF